jgi:hypothetical protein
MKELTEFGKKLPYQESEEYIDDLWTKSIDMALKQTASPAQKARVMSLRRHIFTAIATAAVLILITTVSWKFIGKQFSDNANQQVAVMSESSPLDSFLGSISDEEAEQIHCYQAGVVEEYH